MSPGKPGAGGAGTRRTGWRRRRRRWRLEAATGAPGLGRRAEPDSRIPGTYQDAREMKRAAREAQPPPRSPRLRWALPPLLLLLLSLGQIVCAGDSVSVSAAPVWENMGTATSESTHRVEREMENGQMRFVENQTVGNMGLRPATPSTFAVTAGAALRAQGDSASTGDTTEPHPISGLRLAFVGVMQVALIWKSENGTVTCQILLESIRSCEELTQDLTANISDLKPGIQHNITLYLLESYENHRDPLATESGLDANNTETFTQPPGSPTAPAYPLHHTDPPSDRPLTFHTQVLDFGLTSHAPNKAPVHSQAADGTEGQPQCIDFSTNSSQTFDLKVVNISATIMALSWKMDSNKSCVYIYNIQVTSKDSILDFNVSDTHAIISSLTSSTLYNITVYPFLVSGSGGMPEFLQVYTRPTPVSDFRVTSVSIREIGLAWSSNDSVSFKICITPCGETPVNTTTNLSIVINGLQPATSYVFEIVPQGPNGTEGASQTVGGRTDPSAVFDIHVLHITTTEMQLEWQNTDNVSGYIYHLSIQSEYGTNNTNTSHRAATLRGLIPGTLYNITVSPELSDVWGNSSTIEQYTWPSNVSNLEISVNTTAATLRWQNFDKASPMYIYRLLIYEDGEAHKATEIVTGVGLTSATVTELTPGSLYTAEILTQMQNVTRSLVPVCQSFCTDAAPVATVHCEEVPKEPALVLKWACPPGTSRGFLLEMSSEAWENKTNLESCSLENGTEYRMEVTHLNFFTSYNVSITALSCNTNPVLPAQSICHTGVTDPPVPDGSPNITSVSHNSVKVKFSGFEASHGPIKAYAVILTTGEAVHPSVDVLRYTYEDFKKGASDTYVTYLITTEDKRSSQGLSEVLKYEVDVGNQSTTHGYYNGKLAPLGSYRACVAGFTNITFNPQNDGLIDGTESYVSFSHYSDAVFLPQDPGVICGAVFGCIFGALVIVAVGSFIFWRKKRKDAKNNEVSFSQIKSKLVKVENFEAYFKKQQADSNCGFAEEYEDLKLVGISLPKYAAELAENRGKNRYNNVLPYDISRVKLSVQTHSTDDYVNANYMPGYHSKKDFIATQGPLPNTLKDFWRMVWEKNIYAIVMLTKCVEQGRTKCEEYWPSKQAQDYGNITVAMTSEIILPEWTIRDFTVKNIRTSESHPLRQFHFTSWPDHGVPDATDLLINFRYLVRDYMRQSPPESPVLVHCSAGVGRTGTFIAIDRLIYQIENENTVDVYGIVFDLRMHRPLMVQTEDQYVFLNQCVLDIIRSQKDSKVNLIYQNTTAMTIYENLTPVTAFGKTNGYIA
nr:receptor-type tyrosine-protein phosphatase eta isoform X2 [Manis javanica]